MSLTRIPGNQVPVLEQNGLMSREWYRFFYNLFQLTGGGSTDVTPAELQAEIDVLDTTVAGLSADVSTLDTQVGNIDTALTALTGEVAIVGEESAYAYLSPADNQGEIQKALQDVSLNQIASQINQLSSVVQGLSLQPLLSNNQVQELSLQPPTIVNGDLGIGAFYDTTTQTAAAINTAYAITFNTVSVEKSVYRGSTTSQIYVTSPGWYNFQFSAQLDNTAGGNHLVHIWARLNGSDIADSASQIRLKGTDGELVASWNFFVEMAAGDYFELMYAVSDTAVQIVAQAAASPVPGIPSVILTVNQVYSPYGH